MSLSPAEPQPESRRYTPLSALPSTDAVLACPLGALDVYDVIPGSCLVHYEMLMLKLVSCIVHAPRDSAAKERAWRLFLLTPFVVARRTLRGEAGFRSVKQQERALRLRIRRAHEDQQWDMLWQEMLAAHAKRSEWHAERRASRRPLPSQSGPTAPAIARATRLAKDAEYGRATKALAQAPSLPRADPAIRDRLQELHPSPPSPIVPLPETALPARISLDPSQVSRAVRKMDRTSSAGVNGMPARTLHVIANAVNTPSVGASGLDLLTAGQLGELCTEVINADVPVSIVQLLSAARLVPIDKGGGKIRPVAIGGVLRRLVTKIGIAEDAPKNVPYLLPEQVCSGVRTGGEAMFHAARKWMRRRGSEDNLVLVSIDASNAFNRFSRQKMLDLLPQHCPMLARFINMIYGGEPPPLMYGPFRLASLEGAQQGDPAAMLLFGLVIQPMLKKMSAECPDLLLNIFYADDGTLIGSPEAVARALALIEREGPAVGYYIQPSKSRIYWPAMSREKLQPLLSAYPSLIVQGSPTGEIAQGPDDGITIFGAPLGSDAYVARFLQDKLAAVAEVLENISALPDPRLVYHLQRMTASVCRFTHLARLLPTDSLWRTAVSFDRLQRSTFTQTTGICPTPDASIQLLLPARHGGLGLTSLRIVAPLAHAASLLDTAALRARWSSTPDDPVPESRLIDEVDPLIQRIRPDLAPIPELPDVTAEAVAAHPTHNQKLLTGAVHARLSHRLWRHEDWKRRPRSYPAVDEHLLSLRARFNAVTCPASTAFLTASYRATGYISPPVWAVILRRFLGLIVYACPSDALRCPACASAIVPVQTPLDRDGHHAIACRYGYGYVARHNAVVTRLGRHALSPAALSYRREAPLLVPEVEASLRPADLLVQAPIAATGGSTPKPTALDVTVVTPHPAQPRPDVQRSRQITRLIAAARMVGGAASCAHRRKLSNLRDKVRPTELQNLGFDFRPLAFDAYATPAPETTEYLREVACAVARLSGSPLHLCLRRIYQHTSFAVWAVSAQAILIRDPARIRAAGYASRV